MSAKHLLLRTQAQEKVLHGVSQLADAVRVTLGPAAKAILIERKWGRPLVSDDGVTIAKEFELEDPEENLGVQLGREPAERTQTAVGDGTTTATLLTHALVSEGWRNVVAGASAIELKRGLEHGLGMLENAVSTAGVLLLAEGTMTEIRSKKDEEKAPLPE